MKFHFHKYQGTGNDFVILDNRSEEYSSISKEQVKHICDRRFGIGADGLMLLEKADGYDFRMVYYNSDGNESSMCGNGGRCLVKFALDHGIHRGEYHFLAIDGPHEAEIENNGIINLKMQDVSSVQEEDGDYILNTGSPHYVKSIPDVKEQDIVRQGKEIRYSKAFEKEGINVNFVEVLDEDSIYVRTYERGVEDETLSCGTGVTAAALVNAHNEKGFNRVEVVTPGGRLSVEFDHIDENTFSNIWLCGPAEFVFEGDIEVA